MAYFGLRKPYVAPITDGAYGTMSTCGYAVSMTVTPNSASGSLYGDDAMREYVEEFSNASVELGVTHMPVEMYASMYGHTVSDGAVVFNTNDETPYCGLGTIGVEIIDGEKYYTALFLPKVKFAEPTEELNTKNDSITFGTPAITGTAMVDDTNTWKKSKRCDTEDAAIAYLKTCFGRGE